MLLLKHCDLTSATVVVLILFFLYRTIYVYRYRKAITGTKEDARNKILYGISEMNKLPSFLTMAFLHMFKWDWPHNVYHYYVNYEEVLEDQKKNLNCPF